MCFSRKILYTDPEKPQKRVVSVNVVVHLIEKEIGGKTMSNNSAEEKATKNVELTLQNGIIGFILPIATVLILVLTGSSILFALLAANIVVAAYSLILGIPWQQVEGSIIKGATGVFTAVLIMMMVGIITGVWMISGSVPTLLYYGLKTISPAVFLPLSFILCILTALATGTSWGTAATMGVALIGVSAGLGIPLPVTAGCIISGAVVGDKLSPLSDTTLLASASTKTYLYDHIVSMFYTTVPVGLVALIIYTVIGLKYAKASTASFESINVLLTGIDSTFNTSVLVLIPPILVLVLSMKKVPALIVFSISIVVSIIWAMLFQGAGFNEIIEVAVNGFTSNTGIESLDNLLTRGGAMSMGFTTFITLMAGMLSGQLDGAGFVGVVMKSFRNLVKSPKGLVFSTLAAVAALMLGGGGQYTALTLPGAVFTDAYKDYDVNSAVLSRSMEDVGTMTECIIPWTTSGVYYPSILGVALTSYMPFAFMAWGSPIIAVINCALGIGLLRATDKVIFRPFLRRSKDAPDAKE